MVTISSRNVFWWFPSLDLLLSIEAQEKSVSRSIIDAIFLVFINNLYPFLRKKIFFYLFYTSDQRIKGEVFAFFEGLTLENFESIEEKLKLEVRRIEDETPYHQESINSHFENTYSDNPFIDNIIRNNKKRW